jgi:hypothetical protein
LGLESLIASVFLRAVFTTLQFVHKLPMGPIS